MMRHKRGSVLLLSLFVVTFLVGLNAVSITRTMTELNVANRSLALSRAFHLAEAGVDQALTALNTPGTVNGWTTCAGTSCKTLTLAALGGGDVVIQITDWNGTTPRVVASGFVPNQATPMATRRVEVILGGAGGSVPRVKFALSANDLIRVSGAAAVIDSYDSRLGPYGPGNRFTNAAHLVSWGSLNTNPAIRITSTSALWGDALVLSGKQVGKENWPNPVTLCSPGSTACSPPIQGSVKGFNVPMPGDPCLDDQQPCTGYASSAPPALTTLAPGSSNLGTDVSINPGAYAGALTVGAGRTVTIQAGDFSFTSITVDTGGTLIISPNTRISLTTADAYGRTLSVTNATLTVLGKTNIYFTSSALLGPSATVTNATGTPSDLFLSGQYWGGLTIAPGVSVKAVLMDTRLTLDGELFGALAGSNGGMDSMFINGPVHYDVALRNGFQLVGSYKVLSWRDLP